MERQESGRQAGGAGGRHQFRAHGITGVRRRGSIQAERLGLPLQGQHVFHYLRAILGFRPEHFQKGTGIKGRSRLDGERIGPVADIRHRLDTPLPKLVHPAADGFDPLGLRRRIAQSIDLVDKTGHPGPATEKPPHIGKLDVAVGIYESRHQGAARQEMRFRRHILAYTRPQDGSLVVVFDKTILYGPPAIQGKEIGSGYSIHRSSPVKIIGPRNIVSRWAGRIFSRWSVESTKTVRVSVLNRPEKTSR